MKLPAPRRAHFSSGPNLTSVVDISMVVLIVFMIGARFTLPEHFLQTKAPLTELGEGTGAPAPGTIPDEPLEIVVRPQGSSFIATLRRWEFTSVDALAAQLATVRAEMNQTGTPTDRIQIIISPSGDVQYEHLVAIYEAALNAQYQKVSFSSRK